MLEEDFLEIFNTDPKKKNNLISSETAAQDKIFNRMLDTFVGNIINLTSINLYLVTLNIPHKNLEFFISNQDLSNIDKSKAFSCAFRTHFINITSNLRANIEGFEFHFTTIEFKDVGKHPQVPHLHMLIGVRNLIGLNFDLVTYIHSLAVDETVSNTLYNDIDCRFVTRSFINYKKIIQYIFKGVPFEYLESLMFTSIYFKNEFLKIDKYKKNNSEEYSYRLVSKDHQPKPNTFFPIWFSINPYGLYSSFWDVFGVDTGGLCWKQDQLEIPLDHNPLDLQSIINYEINNIKEDFTYKIYENHKKYHKYLDLLYTDKLTNDKILIHLIKNWMIFKNLKLYKNNLYQKIENSIFSYTFFDTLEHINKNIDNIFYDLINIFPVQFGRINKTKLEDLKLHIDFVLKLIKNTPNILFTINFSWNLIEFSDGIYNITTDTFWRKSENDKILQKINYLTNEFANIDILSKPEKELKALAIPNFFNKNFKYLSLPKYWLDLIKDKLNHNEQDIDIFCSYFGALFHKIHYEELKLRTLWIHGDSNVGKTLLIVTILEAFFGKENIGVVTRSRFALSHLKDKSIGIFDEFDKTFIKEYLSVDTFLKLLQGSSINIDIKYKDPHSLDFIPLIILSNKSVSDVFGDEYLNNIIVHKKYTNRIKDLKFSNPIDNLEFNKEKLLEELPNIIIYCNKLFHTKILKNKYKDKKYFYFFFKKFLFKPTNIKNQLFLK